MSTIGAIGAGWVSRASGLWSPNWPLGPGGCHALQRASGLCSPMVSDHEHNWGHWGRAGVDHEHNWATAGGCHALRAVSRGPCFHGLRSDRGWEGVTRLGPWSPMVSAHERNGPGP